MALEEFSNGYYLLEMNVQPYDEGPVVQDDLHDFLNRRLYSRTNAPVMMRVGLEEGPHFSVETEAAIPSEVMALPRDWMDDMMVESGWHDIFILKPKHAYLLSQSVKLGSEFESHNVND